VRFPRFNALIAIAALLVAPSGPSVSSPSAPSHRTIFAVWPGEKGKQPDAAILDPVVIIDASTFANPMQYNNEDESHAQADFDRFLKDYLQPGQKYQLLFGGSHRGEVVVDQPAGISCETLTATLKAPVPFVNGQKALATTSVEGLGLHSNWRKPATPEQRAAFLVLAAGLLAKHGWSAASQSAIGVRNLRATKLGAGRSEALIGSVTVKEKIAIHNLFLAAEHREGRWSVILSSYHLAKDVEDGTDNVEETFLDQLDLDNDGVDEIVTISGYYESWDYAIYKEQKGTWRQVYKGGGGGC